MMFEHREYRCSLCGARLDYIGPNRQWNARWYARLLGFIRVMYFHESRGCRYSQQHLQVTVQSEQSRVEEKN